MSAPHGEHPRPYVLETAKARALHFSASRAQSRMELARPDRLSLEYTRLMMGFALFVPEARHLAMVGLGGGSIVKFCHRHLPLAHMTAVEINPHVIALRDTFGVPPDDARLRVLQADGAEFIRASHQAFDVLLLDGFGDAGMPQHLCSERFYRACAAALRPGGLLVANLDHGDRDFAARLARLHAAFGTPVLAVPGNDGGNSVVFVAQDDRLARHAIGPLRRPAPLAPEGWAELAAAFARIARTLQAQRGYATPAARAG